MVDLSQVFSTITTSLPIIKISKWDVQIKKNSKNVKKSDSLIGSIIDKAKSAIKLAQDTVSSLFQQTSEGYETIAEFDSFVSFQGEHSSEIVRNAVEKGSFRSVNKIKSPNMVIIELAKGGYRSGIEEVLNRLKKYEGDTTLCRIVTPFGVLDNLNIMKLEYSYTRDNGSNLLIARLTLQEIVGGSVKEVGYKLGITKLPTDTNIQDAGQKVLQSKESVGYVLNKLRGG